MATRKVLPFAMASVIALAIGLAAGMGQWSESTVYAVTTALVVVLVAIGLPSRVPSTGRSQLRPDNELRDLRAYVIDKARDPRIRQAVADYRQRTAERGTDDGLPPDEFVAPFRR